MSRDKNAGFSFSRWGWITLYFLFTIAPNFLKSPLVQDLSPIIITLSLFVAVWLHGQVRYGFKNMVIFLVITWLVSHFFEALSIQTGFPFGHYYYDKLIGPRIFQVPLIIMLAYFGMGYASWTLAHILLRQYHKKLVGNYIFLIPLIGTFMMVMWDLCMDPVASTISSLWVWRNGGAYFGVPLQNYFGWFLVVYIIFQIFALYIAKYDVIQLTRNKIFSSQFFWLEAVAVYAIQAFSQLLDPFTKTNYIIVYTSIALITIFTMVFVSLLSFITIMKFKPVQ